MATPGKAREPQGLAFWMPRVLHQAARAGRDFSPEAVHRLRTALRRCRSMAAVLATADPDPAWGKMQRAGKKLFRRLGALRDTQVLRGWVERLAPAEDAVRAALLELLARQEEKGRAAAQAALGAFDARKWKKWSRRLPERARRIPPDGVLAERLALERWDEARELHRRALRDRSRAGWHRLRIGVKRFRYTVENLLPRRHAAWGADLERVQDLLGDVHDLDVLRELLPRAGAALDAEARQRWRGWMEQERQERLAEYRRKMCGRGSLWRVWRAGLGPGAAPRPRSAVSRPTAAAPSPGKAPRAQRPAARTIPPPARRRRPS
jgi:CHAD domain-containing protein